MNVPDESGIVGEGAKAILVDALLNGINWAVHLQIMRLIVERGRLQEAIGCFCCFRTNQRRNASRVVHVQVIRALPAFAVFLLHHGGILREGA